MKFEEIATPKEFSLYSASITQNYIVEFRNFDELYIYDLDGNKKGEVSLDGDEGGVQVIERDGEFLASGDDIYVYVFSEEDVNNESLIEKTVIGAYDEINYECHSTHFDDYGEKLIIGGTSFNEPFIMDWYGTAYFISEEWELLSVGYDLIVAKHMEKGIHIVDKSMFPLCKIEDEGKYVLTKDDKYLMNYKDNTLKIYEIKKSDENCKISLFKEIHLNSEIKNVDINEKNNNDIGILTDEKVLIYDIQGNLKGELVEKLDEIFLRGDKLIAGKWSDKIKMWKITEDK